MQLHVPYSEHAKAPVGPITMGLPLAMDPKKLGKDLGPLPGWPRLGFSCPYWGHEGKQLGPWDCGLNLRGGWHSKSLALLDLSPWVGLGGGPPSKSVP